MMEDICQLRDNAPETAYIPKNRPGERDCPYLYKSGQRKLLVSEINFLTRYGNRSDTVLYAGAGPGTHLNVLIELFPSIKKWIFYDPQEIKVNKDAHAAEITIVNDYFTADNAREYADKNILFISDIRSFPRNMGKPPPYIANEAIVRDMKLQKDCITNGKFVMSLLKFRMPWKVGQTLYYDGSLFLEPWSGEYSPELRLATDGSVQRTYSHSKLDNQMYHYNRNVRPNIHQNLKQLNLKHHYRDQLIELEVVKRYLITIRQTPAPQLDEAAVTFIHRYCELMRPSPHLE